MTVCLYSWLLLSSLAFAGVFGGIHKAKLIVLVRLFSLAGQISE